MKIKISTNGTITYIYDDLLAGLLKHGDAKIERVSNVEPCEGGWGATMVEDGTFLGPYALRKDALEAEVKYLEQKLFGTGVENGNAEQPV